MSMTADKLVDDYLERLGNALRGLPKARRRELVQEISEYIAEGRASLAGTDEAGIRRLLERLGEPEDIAAEALEPFELTRRRVGRKELAALVLLPIGGVILPVLGWFIGVVLLWISDAWSTRDKLLGTLLVPGGLLLPLTLLLMAEESSGCGTLFTPQLSPRPIATDTCPPTDGTALWGTAVWEVAFVIALGLLSLATTARLARRLGRRWTVFA
jgi:hypothetical protein